MVKFVGMILLGFAACMVAAIPPPDDSNEHPRIRRTTYRHNYNGGSVPVASYTIPHGNHHDRVQINSDGSVETAHHRPEYNIHDNQQYGYNQGYNPGLNQGYNPGLNQGYNPGLNQGYNPGYPHMHGHDDAVIEITKIGKDQFGHAVVSHKDQYSDGHVHESVTHI